MIETAIFEALELVGTKGAIDFPTAAGFEPGDVPRGSWPMDFGSGSQASRSGEDLPARSFVLDWELPLGNLGSPRGLLIGAGALVVTGEEGGALVRLADRSWTALPKISSRGSALDVAGRRLIASDGDSFNTYELPSGETRGYVIPRLSAGNRRLQNLLGPDRSIVGVTVQPQTHGTDAITVVDLLRVVDWARLDNVNEVLGVQTLGGVIRAKERAPCAALTRRGPVLATSAGLTWFDWKLRPVHEMLVDQYPLAISTDDDDRVFYLSTPSGDGRELRIVDRTRGQLVVVSLPVKAEFGFTMAPPIIPASGPIYIVQGPDILAIDRETGAILWHQQRPAGPSATVTADGFLLVADSELYAIDAGGRRRTLWKTRASLVTAPILAGGRIYVASPKALYALRPVD